MLKNLIKLSSGLLCIAVVAGCQSTGSTASTGQVESTDMQAAALNSRNSVLQLAAASPYTVLRLKPGNRLGLSYVMTGPRYRSASGRVCKPLLDSKRLSIGQLVCNKGKNNWYVQRALNLSDHSASVDTSSVVSVDSNSVPVSDNTIAHPVQEATLLKVAAQPLPAGSALNTDTYTNMDLKGDETLWAFAVRVTGNGLNWETIAADNGIVDAQRMSKDTQLKVSNQLIKQ